VEGLKEIRWQYKHAFMQRTHVDSTWKDAFPTLHDKKPRFEVKRYGRAQHQLQGETAELGVQETVIGHASIPGGGSGTGIAWGLRRRETAHIQMHMMMNKEWLAKNVREN
jgi:hypothetical protein